jgi:hypothetical protein
MPPPSSTRQYPYQRRASTPPRRDHATKLHPLVNILVIALCGLIAGANSFVEIALFGETKKAWLSQFLDLEHGLGIGSIRPLFNLCPWQTSGRDAVFSPLPRRP